VFLAENSFKIKGLSAIQQELRTTRTVRGNLMARKFGSSNQFWKQWIQNNLFDDDNDDGHHHNTTNDNIASLSTSNLTTTTTTNVTAVTIIPS
jgi:hypothetical protein